MNLSLLIEKAAPLHVPSALGLVAAVHPVFEEYDSVSDRNKHEIFVAFDLMAHMAVERSILSTSVEVVTTNSASLNAHQF